MRYTGCGFAVLLGVLVAMALCLAPGAGYASGSAGPVRDATPWPTAQDMFPREKEGYWQWGALHGPVKSVRVNAVLAEKREDGEISPVMPEEQSEDAGFGWEVRSYFWHYPVFERKDAPYLDVFGEDGRMIRHEKYDPDGGLRLSVDVAWNGNGTLDRETVCDHAPVDDEPGEGEAGGCVTVAYGYDGAGRLVSIVPDSDAFTPPEFYVYDSDGLLAEARTFTHTMTAQGKGKPSVWVAHDRKELYTYDSMGRMQSNTRIHEGQSTHYTYSYEGLHRYSHLGEPPTEANRLPGFVEMDEAGRITADKTLFAFSPGDVNHETTVYARDDAGRLRARVYHIKNGGDEWTTTDRWVYDDKGNMTRRSTSKYGQADAFVQTFFYDARGNWTLSTSTNVWGTEEREGGDQPVIIRRAITYYP